MRRLALILLLVPALAGCTQPGSSSTAEFKGDERDVAAAISDFSSSASRKEASKACSESLSVALAKKVALGGKSCYDELKKAFDDTDLQTIDIDDVTIDEPQHATAKVSSSSGNDDFQSTFTMVDEDGDWRIDSFGTASQKR
jgi:hypothetical protein